MKYANLIIILGLWTIAVPFLGIPLPWKIFFIAGTGAVLVIVGVVGRAFEMRSKPKQKKSRAPAMSAVTTADQSKNSNHPVMDEISQRLGFKKNNKDTQENASILSEEKSSK